MQQKTIKLLFNIVLISLFATAKHSKFFHTYESREVADFVVILCSTEQASWKSVSLAKTRSAVFFLNKLKHNSLQRRKVSAKHLALFTLYVTVFPIHQTAVAN